MDLWSLQGLLEAWPGRPEEREAWRTFARRAEAALRERAPGHWPGPALVPGLLQARLAAALGLAGLTRGDRLRTRVLTLGAHAGLEVRMLRDFGFEAVGLEQRPELAAAGRDTGLLPPDSLVTADYRAYLADPGPAWPLILALAPEAVDPAWIATARRRLAPEGQLVVVAYWADLPAAWHSRARPVVEGLMGGLRWEAAPDSPHSAERQGA
ncbi:conserved protein of unknown function [Candidatus Hydrogenisulfobacillus filiaventi]|uniref:Uncharacterized protein n=1 Tax=Candidatus Hydrogenisulfobacillus filiaventi TaxID=2707344 RepID=A0A6F8ZDR8_9FIRM|nr:conserved protein of unknown function [Candidatus Hydrogenisulfobacillus filiaventi]